MTNVHCKKRVFNSGNNNQITGLKKKVQLCTKFQTSFLISVNF